MPTFPRTAEADKQLNVLRNSDPLLKMFRDAYGSINKEILEPLGPYNPEAPALAVVPTALNIGKFLEKLARAKKAQTATEIAHEIDTGIPFKMTDAVRNALAYVETRYPRVVGSVMRGVEATPDLPATTHGRTNLNPEGIPTSIGINSSMANPSDAVNTIAHELKHVRDIKRGHWTTKVPYYYPEQLDKDSLGRLSNQLRLFLYHNQPIEARASAAGTNAEDSYKKFIKMFGEQ